MHVHKDGYYKEKTGRRNDSSALLGPFTQKLRRQNILKSIV